MKWKMMAIQVAASFDYVSEFLQSITADAAANISTTGLNNDNNDHAE